MTSTTSTRFSAARKHARALTVCAAALGFAVTPAIASAAAASHTSAPSAYHRTVVRTVSSPAAQHPVVATAVVHATAVSDVTTDPTYQVQSGDTLSGIAARALGNGSDYHEIFKLNKDHVESDGTRFTNPNLIQVGWTLTLPAGSQPVSAPAQQAAPATTSSESDSSGSDSSSASSSDDSSANATASTDSSSSSSDTSSDSSSSSSDNSDNSGYSDDLNGWIEQAQAILADNGYQVSYNAIYETAMNESSGDPDAVNNWDSNAAEGTPSEGLMQVIEPTFEAYALPGYNTDILDPVSNIIAAAIYAQDTYGGLDNVVDARCGGSCWSGY